MKTQNKVRDFILLHVVLMVYSIASLFSKMASTKEFMSFQFILYYALVLLVMFVYAILWQQILKKMSLTTAFLNKSVVVVWGIIWGAIFFKEHITWNMVVGTIIIIAGICVVVKDEQ